MRGVWGLGGSFEAGDLRNMGQVEGGGQCVFWWLQWMVVGITDRNLLSE